MNTINFPLIAGMTGEALADLQDAMRTLLDQGTGSVSGIRGTMPDSQVLVSQITDVTYGVYDDSVERLSHEMPF